MGELLARHGLDAQKLTGGKPLKDLTRIAAFFEAHIEQSAKLDNSKTARVGLVTGIRGIRLNRRIRAIGVGAHAGGVGLGENGGKSGLCHQRNGAAEGG